MELDGRTAQGRQGEPVTWRKDWADVPFDREAMEAHARRTRPEGRVKAYVELIETLHAALTSTTAMDADDRTETHMSNEDIAVEDPGVHDDEHEPLAALAALPTGVETWSVFVGEVTECSLDGRPLHRPFANRGWIECQTRQRFGPFSAQGNAEGMAVAVVNAGQAFHYEAYGKRYAKRIPLSQAVSVVQAGRVQEDR